MAAVGAPVPHEGQAQTVSNKDASSRNLDYMPDAMVTKGPPRGMEHASLASKAVFQEVQNESPSKTAPKALANRVSKNLTAKLNTAVKVIIGLMLPVFGASLLLRAFAEKGQKKH